jgi:hypothetical protein
MFTLFLIGCVAIIINGLHQYHKWQLSFYQDELSHLQHQNNLQAEKIEQLETERARLHWQLLAHLNEPGQEVNAYRN